MLLRKKRKRLPNRYQAVKKEAEMSHLEVRGKGREHKG